MHLHGVAGFNRIKTVGMTGAMWNAKQHSFAPDSVAYGPFPTSYSAYRNALQHGPLG